MVNAGEDGLDLTDAQIHALFFLPVPTAALSLCGSLLVIQAIVSEHHYNLSRLWEKTGTYERLLLAMSCCDIIASTSLALEAFFTTSDLSRFSIGTPGTCRAMGALFQFSLSGMAYYCMLSYYFLLQIRFQMRNIATRAEPFMHLFGFGWPFSTAIVGAILDWYDELQFYPGCWIGEYPRGCEGDECKGNIIGWTAGGGIVMIILISLCVNNITITYHVAKRYGKVKFGRRGMSGTLSDQDALAQRVRFVATQATLYILAFFATYIWNIILRIVESMDPPDTIPGAYFLMVLQAFFTPIAGFFNAIIFFRPRYIAVRRRYSRETKAWAVRRTIWGGKIEPTLASGSSGSSTNLGASTHFFSRIMRFPRLAAGSPVGLNHNNGDDERIEGKNRVELSSDNVGSDEFKVDDDDDETRQKSHKTQGPDRNTRRVSFSRPPEELVGRTHRGNNRSAGQERPTPRQQTSSNSDLHSFALSLLMSISTASVEPMDDFESDIDEEDEEDGGEEEETDKDVTQDTGSGEHDEFLVRLSECGLSSGIFDNEESNVTVDA